jgi:lipopolysaccharide export system permease protein
MKLLDRYVGQQILLTGLFAVGVLSVVLVLGNFFKELLNVLLSHEAPMELVLSALGYILPFSLTFTIPWGFLTAVLLVFGKMSAENELIALRANGVSITRISYPVFAAAAVCAGICLWINVDVAPRAELKAKDAVYKIATSNPLAMFGSDKVIDAFPGKKIYIEQNTGAELENIFVYELNEEQEPMRVLFARTGRLETDREGNQLLLHLYRAQLEQRDEADPSNLAKLRTATAEETTFPISLQALYEKNKKKKGLSSMTVSELAQRLTQEKAKQLAKEDVRKEESARSEARTEVSKRFSFSLASLAFALLGVPLAITAHRKETSIGFMLSVGIAFVYFFLFVITDTQKGNPSVRPELLIWAPNLIFMGLGAWLFYRLSRR